PPAYQHRPPPSPTSATLQPLGYGSMPLTGGLPGVRTRTSPDTGSSTSTEPSTPKVASSSVSGGNSALTKLPATCRHEGRTRVPAAWDDDGIPWRLPRRPPLRGGE